MSGVDAARSAVPWDLSFLRMGTLVTLAGTVVAAPVAGLIAGWPGVLGVLTGAAVVTAFFSLSGLVIAWAGRIGEAFTLPAALGTFMVKALVFFAVLSEIPVDGPISRLTLAWTVVAGALLWSAVHGRWVWTRPLYYVQPPSPPSSAASSAASSAEPLADPEKPTTRG